MRSIIPFVLGIGTAIGGAMGYSAWQERREQAQQRQLQAMQRAQQGQWIQAIRGGVQTPGFAPGDGQVIDGPPQIPTAEDFKRMLQGLGDAAAPITGGMAAASDAAFETWQKAQQAAAELQPLE